MVDKLRKAGLWIWLFKERVILLVMVAALANQVYLLLNPAPPEQATPLQSPRKEIAEGVDQSIIPPQPPILPPEQTTSTGGGLSDRNPFWYYASTGEDSKSSDIPSDLIQLVKIQKIGDRVRCQLQTRTTKKWYNVNEKFEEFQLQAIDPDAQTATVFVESYGKTVVLKAQS